MPYHEGSCLAERPDVAAFGQQTTVVTNALNGLIVLGPRFGLTSIRQRLATYTDLESDKRLHEPERLYSRSPWIIREPGSDSSHRVGKVERIATTKCGETARAYTIFLSPACERMVSILRLEDPGYPQAFTNDNWHPRATEIPVPSIEDLLTPSSYFNPLNVLRFIRRESYIDRMKAAMPMLQSIAHELVTAAQSPELNPLIAQAMEAPVPQSI